MIDNTTLRLSRNAFGRLVFTGADGETYEGIIPARAFPISAPDEGIALIDRYGHELAWIDQLNDLPGEVRELIEADLAKREFMPEVTRIRDVSNYATPSTWYVDTDRGKTSFILKGEEYIRRLMPPALLITDSQGIHFLVRDRFALDHHSRKILDRFL
ncbi:cyanophycin metabolism-associated DUF1854 family protein [Nitrosospira briensis]|uniref:cyanophycin metabolism-associated DUF1854 family protein n=1 Tax=Nitrosospira briensis TaxID=35799 RepID=UPI0008E629A3|nr:DUF1854 domain-containing protein [Nitrosospira briensis]SFO09951.1 protein of unknown function [Nitrosospira briensis]